MTSNRRSQKKRVSPSPASGAAASRATKPVKTARVRATTQDPDTDGSLGATLEFMRLLWAVDHGLQQRSKRMEVEVGVTGMQRIVIRLIGRYPNITAGRLAELLHVHPSTLTGVLKRIVSRGLSERVRDPDDARKSRFSLTAEGTEIDSTQAGTVEAAVRRALGKLNAADLTAAQSVLSVLANELGRRDR